jgi:hypothetical protein
MHALDPYLVEHIEIVEGEIGDVLDPVGGWRAGMARMTRGTHGEMASELGMERPPTPAAARPVQEEQGFACSRSDHLRGRPPHAEGVPDEASFSQ